MRRGNGIMTTGKKTNLHTFFRFRLEISGITVAIISEVTGLPPEAETKHKEKDVNTDVHRLPKKIKYQPLTLKRGITNSMDLWTWYNGTGSGKIERKDGAIVMLDAAGEDAWRWNFTGAYPVQWAGPDFKADSSAIAFESVTLEHHGLWKG